MITEKETKNKKKELIYNCVESIVSNLIVPNFYDKIARFSKSIIEEKDSKVVRIDSDKFIIAIDKFLPALCSSITHVINTKENLAGELLLMYIAGEEDDNKNKYTIYKKFIEFLFLKNPDFSNCVKIVNETRDSQIYFDFIILDKDNFDELDEFFEHPMSEDEILQFMQSIETSDTRITEITSMKPQTPLGFVS